MYDVCMFVGDYVQNPVSGCQYELPWHGWGEKSKPPSDSGIFTVCLYDRT